MTLTYVGTMSINKTRKSKTAFVFRLMLVAFDMDLVRQILINDERQ